MACRTLASTAVVVCDMWDATNCVSAQRRVEALALRMNVVLAALRAAGALIVHAPAGCMDFYRDHPARVRAHTAPYAATAVAIDWNEWSPDELATLPVSLTDPGYARVTPRRPAPLVGHRTLGADRQHSSRSSPSTPARMTVKNSSTCSRSARSRTSLSWASTRICASSAAPTASANSSRSVCARSSAVILPIHFTATRGVTSGVPRRSSRILNSVGAQASQARS